MRRLRLPAHWYAAIFILHLNPDSSLLYENVCLGNFCTQQFPGRHIVRYSRGILRGDRLERLCVPQDVSTQQCVGCEYLAGLSDHFKSGQRLSLQNRPMEGAGTKLLYSASTLSGKSDHDRSCCSGSVLRSLFCAEAIAHFTTHDPVGGTRGGSGCPAS